MRERNFRDDLQASHSWAHAPWWAEVYRKAFPALAGIVETPDEGWGQASGIDRILTLSSGKTVAVDEKVRQEDYDDIALEYLHVYQSGNRKPGWIKKDLHCDFIAYAFIPSRRCYMLPFQTLRRAWETMGRDWHESARNKRNGFRIADSPNQYNGTRWHSLSVCVPIPVLMSALNDAMLVRWTGAEQAPLPLQTVLL